METQYQQRRFPRNRSLGGQPEERGTAAPAARGQDALGAHADDEHRRHVGRGRRRRRLGQRVDRAAAAAAVAGGPSPARSAVGRPEEGRLERVGRAPARRRPAARPARPLGRPAPAARRPAPRPARRDLRPPQRRHVEPAPPAHRAEQDDAHRWRQPVGRAGKVELLS